MGFEVKPQFRKFGIALLLFLTIGLMRVNFARAAGTPTYPSPFSVNYFVNANQSGLDELYIQNKSNNGTSIQGQNVCALVYAFYPDQEMVGCCSTLITPNETFTNSIGQLLIHVDKVGPLPTKGTIKVVSSLPGPGGTCDAEFPNTLIPSVLTSWITHTSNVGGTALNEEPLAQTGEPLS